MVVNILVKVPHCAKRNIDNVLQLLTGYFVVKREGWKVTLVLAIHLPGNTVRYRRRDRCVFDMILVMSETVFGVFEQV